MKHILWTAIISATLAGCVGEGAGDGPVPPNGTPPTALRPDNGREHFRGSPLPQSEVLGTDDNADHIRDDVEVYIDDEFADREWARLAARQFARSVQRIMAHIDDRARVRALATDQARAIKCLRHTLGAEGTAARRALEAKIIDNDARATVYLRMNGQLGGMYFRDPQTPENACDFDLAGLTP